MMSATIVEGRAITARGRRPLVIALLFATHFLTYLDRAVMATAIPFIARDFHLSSVAAGSVLSAFFFGYALMQIPSGILADKIGPTRMLVTAILCWSIFTALTGLVQSVAMLIVVRILFGLSEGPAPAAVSKTIAIWAPRDQVGRSFGIVLASTLVGSAAAPVFVTAIILHGGWRIAFLSLLVPGLLLALAISALLGRYQPPVRDEDAEATAPAGAASTWKTILGSSPIRWCIAVNFLAGAANWGLQNWLPTYLLNARGFGIAQLGMFASMPYAAAALGYLLGGQVGDRLFAGRRHVLILTCLLAAALGVYGAAVAPSGMISVAFMTAAFLLMSMALSTLFAMPLLLVPVGLTGTAFGIANTAAQIAGFVSPLMIGAVLDATHQNYAIALYLVVALLVAAAAAASRIGDATAPIGGGGPASATGCLTKESTCIR